MSDSTSDGPDKGLTRARLDEAGIEALFADYRDEARVLSVRLKGAKLAHSEDESDLMNARDALLSRTARGAQVQYKFADERWCDTILTGPHGWRIIRSQGPG